MSNLDIFIVVWGLTDLRMCIEVLTDMAAKLVCLVDTNTQFNGNTQAVNSVNNYQSTAGLQHH